MLVRFFCKVGFPTEVATVWSRLANCAKSEQHTVIIQEFQRVCRAPGLATELYTPVVTASLKQTIVGFQFVGLGMDDLASGCQPFTVPYAGGASQLQALASADIGNQLAQGEQSASLADYRALREKEKVKFPRDAMDVIIAIGRYAVLCQTLFLGTGPDNPFVSTIWKLYAALSNAAPYITNKKYHQQVAITPSVANMYFPCILRAVQVSVQEYLQSVGTNVADSHVGVDLPDFKALLWDLKHGTFRKNGSNWIPLPDGYLTTTARGGWSGSGARALPRSVSTTGGSTVASGVSSLTTADTRTMAVRVDNPGPGADFTSIVVRPGGTRPIRREHPLPRNDAGREFCIAWWTSICFANCRRSGTHAPFTSDAERSRLLTFCREHIAAPAAAAASRA